MTYAEMRAADSQSDWEFVIVVIRKEIERRGGDLYGLMRNCRHIYMAIIYQAITLDNNIKRDADQNNKMKTYRKFKTIDNYKCDDYLCQVKNYTHHQGCQPLKSSNIETW